MSAEQYFSLCDTEEQFIILSIIIIGILGLCNVLIDITTTFIPKTANRYYSILVLEGGN